MNRLNDVLHETWKKLNALLMVEFYREANSGNTQRVSELTDEINAMYREVTRFHEEREHLAQRISSRIKELDP